MSKVFVITGGSDGMGKAIARRLGQQGALLLADVSEERLQAAIEKLAVEGITDVSSQVVDNTKKEQVEALAAAAARLRELGAIVHTAGLSPTMGSGRRIMEVNMVGTGLILKAFLPLAVPGSVAHGSSDAGYARRFAGAAAITTRGFHRWKPLLVIQHSRIQVS
ncbi:SDR family NAD(P)-dependent oxidoreductase [Paenibacillus sp. PR3]|uniref:SDR family NAD(P)-dependent oxidoreductase n=1 Tax=Paenibacillus terricola TaxID=2763503 RepID=A0ABR8MXD1_9BACL|nr:SDR family NAD(P)-dependent oxidoreductase [Paenibacillus terricola]MBD3919701.1 SDR family NAD(P)-dependent oxidoreductase [Paenibacillus terricola]